jgi:hypothetical protein
MAVPEADNDVVFALNFVNSQSKEECGRVMIRPLVASQGDER